MKYYKLTDQQGRTRNTQWGEAVTHTAIGKGVKLCSEGVIHVYDSPIKAVLFNPIHANFAAPLLWEVKVRRVVANDGLKVGVKRCTTIKQIPLPSITTEKRVEFAIRCALAVYKAEDFAGWVKNWLSGEDKSKEAAESAAWSAAESAVWAAESAAWSAAGATWAAWSTAGSAAESAAESAAQTTMVVINEAVKETFKAETNG